MPSRSKKILSAHGQVTCFVGQSNNCPWAIVRMQQKSGVGTRSVSQTSLHVRVNERGSLLPLMTEPVPCSVYTFDMM